MHEARAPVPCTNHHFPSTRSVSMRVCRYKTASCAPMNPLPCIRTPPIGVLRFARHYTVPYNLAAASHCCESVPHSFHSRCFHYRSVYKLSPPVQKTSGLFSLRYCHVYFFKFPARHELPQACTCFRAIATSQPATNFSCSSRENNPVFRGGNE